MVPIILAAVALLQEDQAKKDAAQAEQRSRWGASWAKAQDGWQAFMSKMFGGSSEVPAEVSAQPVNQMAASPAAEATHTANKDGLKNDGLKNLIKAIQKEVDGSSVAQSGSPGSNSILNTDFNFTSSNFGDLT